MYDCQRIEVNFLFVLWSSKRLLKFRISFLFTVKVGLNFPQKFETTFLRLKKEIKSLSEHLKFGCKGFNGDTSVVIHYRKQSLLIAHLRTSFSQNLRNLHLNSGTPFWNFELNHQRLKRGLRVTMQSITSFDCKTPKLHWQLSLAQIAGRYWK